MTFSLAIKIKHHGDYSLKRIKASAPAKVILLGEHFVVHGEPAIVLAIDKRATVTVETRNDSKIFIESKDIGASGFFVNDEFHPKMGGKEAGRKLEPIYAIVKEAIRRYNLRYGININIESSIPVGAGLGSSAAVSVATASAIFSMLDPKVSKDTIFNAAFNAEKIVHETPSGVDPAVSTYGGILWYCRSKPIRRLKIDINLPLVIGNTGKERSTGKLVAKVNKLRSRYPLIVGKIIKAGGEIVKRSVKALREGDLKTLGELMNIDHELLRALGVSCRELEELIYAAREAGALGAKLTGAGGGGCMIALAYPEKIIDVAHAIKEAGGEVLITEKTDEGVIIEK